MNNYPKHRQPIFLYSIWRNGDDRLMILDGTADECCKVLGIPKKTFYEELSRTGGKGKKYTIKKIRYKDAMRESGA